MNSFIHFFIRSFIHSFNSFSPPIIIRSFVCTFIHSFSLSSPPEASLAHRPFIHSCILLIDHSLNRSLFYSFTYLLEKLHSPVNRVPQLDKLPQRPGIRDINETPLHLLQTAGKDISPRILQRELVHLHIRHFQFCGDQGEDGFFVFVAEFFARGDEDLQLSFFGESTQGTYMHGGLKLYERDEFISWKNTSFPRARELVSERAQRSAQAKRAVQSKQRGANE